MFLEITFDKIIPSYIRFWLLSSLQPPSLVSQENLISWVVPTKDRTNNIYSTWILNVDAIGLKRKFNNIYNNFLISYSWDWKKRSLQIWPLEFHVKSFCWSIFQCVSIGFWIFYNIFQQWQRKKNWYKVK